jgi:hypothetical protein
MQKLMKNVLRKYPKKKSINFKGKYNNIITEKGKNAIKILLDNDIDFNKYRIYGSCGMGRWADVPWIGIFDKEITEKAIEGYYIVYLFDKQMKGVYLSLNQGWSWFQDEFKTKLGNENALKVRYYWRERIKSPFKELTVKDINMNSENKNPQGYEKCHIFGKHYKKSEIPKNEILKKDLLMILEKYEELKNKMCRVDKRISIEETNKKILNIKNYDKITVENDYPHNHDPVKIDYKMLDAKNQELGLDGEIAVLEHEQKRLKELGLNVLSENVKHASKEEGDGLGYDILSYDERGNEKYIEVKTTKHNRDTPFFITDGELKFSKENPEKYSLYRVYDFDKNSPLFFEETQGDLTKKFKFKPTIYKSEKM